MSASGFRIRPFSRRLPAWPYFFLCAAAVAFGLVFTIGWWPEDYPAEEDLVQFSGEIERIEVRDDISDSSAGALMPALSSVYFTLQGIDGEFRYSSAHPQYPLVRNHTSVALDVWVEGDAVGSGEPMTIWQIRERNPFNEADQEETFVSYDEIVARLTKSSRAMVRLGAWLLVGAAMLFLIGLAVRRHNRTVSRTQGRP